MFKNLRIFSLFIEDNQDSVYEFNIDKRQQGVGEDTQTETKVKESWRFAILYNSFKNFPGERMIKLSHLYLKISINL